MKVTAVWFFHFMAQWGVWDMLGLLVALVPSVLVLWYLFPRKAIQNFYIDAKIASNQGNQTYPNYVLSEGFVFGDTILPSPHGAKERCHGRL